MLVRWFLVDEILKSTPEYRALVFSVGDLSEVFATNKHVSIMFFTKSVKSVVYSPSHFPSPPAWFLG